MKHDIIVIGGGPAGYTIANLSAKNGLKTALIEKNRVGGTCLNIGCIPTKALISRASLIKKMQNSKSGIYVASFLINIREITWEVKTITDNISKGVEFLLNKNKVDIIEGEASFLDKNTIIVDNNEYKGDKIIIATGSKPADFLKFLKPNISKEKILRNKIITSSNALFLYEIPKSITIIGGGVMGVEFAYIFNAFGSSVTIVEYFENLLPNIDNECGKLLERLFTRSGIKVITSANIKLVDNENGVNKINYEKNGKSEIVESEYVLFTNGMVANTDNLDLEKIGIEKANDGRIVVNDLFQTNIDNIYAIGDVASGYPMLAHVAYHQARNCINNILKKEIAYDLKYIPSCIYTEPEIAVIGLSEKEAKEKNIDYKVLKTFFKASGKATAIGINDGFVKIVVSRNGAMLGASIVGYNATEIIGTICVAIKNNIKIDDLNSIMFPHPTIVESITDATKIFFDEEL